VVFMRVCLFRHHPDLDESPDAHIRFMAAQRAYEILIGRRRGKEDREGVWSEGGGWDFHDWCGPANLVALCGGYDVYEILVGRGRGKEDREGVWSQGGDWDFHDWCGPGNAVKSCGVDRYEIVFGRGRGKTTERASGQREVVGIFKAGAARAMQLHHVGLIDI
jgi:hypothetical protein